MNLGPALIDEEFAKHWDDATLGDLYNKIHMLMPRDDPGTLGEQQAVDLLAFILSKTKYPAGNAELPADVEQLSAYKFLAKKPAAK